MSEIPEGWTDDMTVPLLPNHTVDRIIDFVIQQALQGTSDAETENKLMAAFGFSSEESALVRDRVFGGIVRATTANKSNRPDSKKDPFAYASFNLALRNPSMIASLYPQFVQSKKRPWWKFW